MFIGLTGYMGSGKGEIVKILEKEGYKYISLSNAVREEATKRGIEHTRENLQNVGNNLRKEFGAGVLGLKIREKILAEGGDNWVIDGIRNPAEIDELKKLPYLYLVGVSAARDLLIERVISRSRESDSQTEAEIIARLDREEGKGEPADGQQVKKCLERVDYLILNEGTLEDLENRFSHYMKLLKNEDRPSFDEIFMDIAASWSKRATCLRRKVGAVIAKDGQQLTAGYNGAPRGVPHCADLGGCLREKLGIPSGQRHEICRGTHAEQNAITQAAKFGIDISGSTLYCNTFPCVICSKMILNSGIKEVIYDSDYDDPLSKEILSQQNILTLRRYEGLRRV
ncbi:MAG: Deoxycytidylate deaminase [Candidatus Peregrinibacteria bacterium GW2011_GWA2_33_10]|nr:MAG: Deoxycytidylate deaminase [Candidatus Peregrinibacteria bacterium GW2011_GWA2_33_10]KKP41037.1 MAG: dCMP deaminase, dCMP deaminase [Candidatus Peregrinibacteria bacterium GW2011_GWC2_33_13]